MYISTPIHTDEGGEETDIGVDQRFEFLCLSFGEQVRHHPEAFLMGFLVHHPKQRLRLTQMVIEIRVLGQVRTEFEYVIKCSGVSEV